MPPRVLFDLSAHDLDRPRWDKAAVRELNPQRGSFEMLDAIVFCDAPDILGIKHVRHDEFWVHDHIPGRPLFPGVLMIEATAQVASAYCKLALGWTGFIGFGGVGEFKFRLPVEPGSTLLVLTRMTRERHGRVTCDAQGLVNGNIVFEGEITGTRM